MAVVLRDARLKELEAEQGRLTAQLGDENRFRPSVHPNMAKIYRQKVERLGETIRDRGDEREAFELLRSLIEEVRLVLQTGPYG